ncbi:helix-turn-helix transcriptional regulator [Streptomyces mirabilis]|uniref:winged helix-turn-helix transcriptional regulator n=1 Tax=Streptomyces mirabilis TaxID=68239 RepID=UPI0021BE7CE0|nr:helix-turn-helix domain-containing protein [Streptomyces mirabilis]MCT9109072.1 helix-turn-helix transcriptional regulator [Streptomyces mirabilis]
MTNPSAQTDPQDPQDSEPSPTIHALTRAFALLGKRWNGLVLAALAQGPAGFGEVRERVPGISDRMLADRLHELAVAGLLTRTVHHGPPLRSQYALTPHGNAFLIPLAAPAVWAEEHRPRHPGRPRHKSLAGQP